MCKSKFNTLSCALMFALVTATTGGQAAELRPPTLEKAAEPEYPATKKGSGESAVVLLLLTIDSTGKVTKVVLSNGADPLFNEAAVDAAKKLLFAPATKDRVPIVAKIPFRMYFADLPRVPNPPR